MKNSRIRVIKMTYKDQEGETQVKTFTADYGLTVSQKKQKARCLMVLPDGCEYVSHEEIASR